MGCHFLVQGIFLTQGSNPSLLCLLHRQEGSLPLAPPGKMAMSAGWGRGDLGERGLCPRPASRGRRPTTAPPTVPFGAPDLCTHSPPGLAGLFLHLHSHLRGGIRRCVVFRVGRRLSLVGGASTCPCHQPLKPLGRNRTGTREAGPGWDLDAR